MIRVWIDSHRISGYIGPKLYFDNGTPLRSGGRADEFRASFVAVGLKIDAVPEVSVSDVGVPAEIRGPEPQLKSWAVT
jgi:hypothetical protein